MKYENVKKLSNKKFKRAVGIPRELFEILISILEIEFKLKHSKGGKNSKLSVENILIMFLTFYRNYPTFFDLGIQFELNESNAYRWVKWVEDILFEKIGGAQVSFSEYIELRELDSNHEHIVDVTECTIQRPKNYEIQRKYYSGKKKKHTIKIQIVIDEVTTKIISIAFDKGSVHDFELFKKTTKDLNELTEFLADSGYQGISNIFKNSMTPKKKSKNIPLTDEDKELNKLISSTRIPVEHVNCQVKIFRILSERYGSRIKTFFKRAILICEFYNLCT